MHYIYTCTHVAIPSLSYPNTHSECPRFSVNGAIEYGSACDNTLAARSTDGSLVAVALWRAEVTHSMHTITDY